MPFFLVASFALTMYFIFMAEASWVGKGVVFGLFMFSLTLYFGWIPVSPFIGMLFMGGLSIYIILYLKWHKMM